MSICIYKQSNALKQSIPNTVNVNVQYVDKIVYKI